MNALPSPLGRASALPSPLDEPVDVVLVDFDRPHCESCLRTGPMSRGLCKTCYWARARDGLLGMYPARYRSGALVVSEFRHLLSAGVAVRDMPARLGMSRPAFDRAVQRARAGGAL